MEKTIRRRALSRFASNILFCGAVLVTVLCVGYIANLEYMSAQYKDACEFYALLMAELVSFTCFADYIHKTM
ncbi:MAG TPA: hypothetical protein DD733_09380 [Clostridiales bacterium]|nr:hypothetical protein [Eubacteriales bacterium]HBR32279.1 hypothetical protein [Clostridiales bacterium]